MTVEGQRRPPSGSPPDELAVARVERELWAARLRRAEAERDGLRVDLAEAMAQAEYWRTLAEYRERRLVERQDNCDGGEPRLCPR
jgi:hypothetical protein